MSMTATPFSSAAPPFVRLQIETDNPGDVFLDLEVYRNGKLLREQPFVGGSVAVVDDITPPFGVPLPYTAEGTILPAVTPDWTETWADLSNWSGDTADWSVSAGEALSTVSGAAISRGDTSGPIQRISVTDPVLVLVELLGAGDTLVCSLLVDATTVVLTGESSVQATGGGSFTLLLGDTTVTASAMDDSWSLSRPYSGAAISVRLTSLNPVRVKEREWSTPYSDGMAVSSDGTVYAASSTDRAVLRWDSNGSPLSSWPTTDTPIGIGVSSSGDVYVSLLENGGSIQKLSSSGVVLDTWTFLGFLPRDIAFDSVGNLYITDLGNYLVHKFDSTGSEITSWGVLGWIPWEIDLDSGDNVYVSDYPNSKIYKFDSSGASITSWSTEGRAFGLTLDASDIVYVGVSGGTGDPRFIRMYSSSGVGLGSIAVPSKSLTYMGVDGDDNLYAMNRTTSSTILKYSPTRNTSVGEIEVTPEAIPESFSAAATTILDVQDQGWFIHPIDPNLSFPLKFDGDCTEGIVVSMETKRTKITPSTATLLRPVGRRRSIAIRQEKRPYPSFDLVVNTLTLADRNQLEAATVDDVPLLLRVPPHGVGCTPEDWDIPDDWYSIGDIPEDYLDGQPLDSPYRVIVLPLRPVEPPSLISQSRWTYGDGYLLYATYAESRAAEPTYLDRYLGPGE